MSFVTRVGRQVGLACNQSNFRLALFLFPCTTMDDQGKFVSRLSTFRKSYTWMVSCTDGEENIEISSNFEKVQNYVKIRHHI
jgi:hypothetical protein